MQVIIGLCGIGFSSQVPVCPQCPLLISHFSSQLLAPTGPRGNRLAWTSLCGPIAIRNPICVLLNSGSASLVRPYLMYILVLEVTPGEEKFKDGFLDLELAYGDLILQYD